MKKAHYFGDFVIITPNKSGMSFKLNGKAPDRVAMVDDDAAQVLHARSKQIADRMSAQAKAVRDQKDTADQAALEAKLKAKILSDLDPIIDQKIKDKAK